MNFKKGRPQFMDGLSFLGGIMFYLKDKLVFININQDKNKRFDERTLGQIRTLNSIPEYSFSDIVQRSQ